MSVIRDVAFWGGVGLCVAVVALVVALVLYRRATSYEDARRPTPVGDDDTYPPAMPERFPAPERPDGRPA